MRIELNGGGARRRGTSPHERRTWRVRQEESLSLKVESHQVGHLLKPVSLTDFEDVMKLNAARYLGLGLVGLTVMAAVLTGIGAGQEPKRTRRDFMRQKLDFAKEALEGLALEQYGTLEKSARALKRLSEAAEWEVPTIPNATDYVAMTSEFQRNADEMAKQAKQRNIDGATLAYLKLTINCVQCHKFVRFADK
jgi:hypothetical protein